MLLYTSIEILSHATRELARCARQPYFLYG